MNELISHSSCSEGMSGITKTSATVSTMGMNVVLKISSSTHSRMRWDRTGVQWEWRECTHARVVDVQLIDSEVGSLSGITVTSRFDGGPSFRDAEIHLSVCGLPCFSLRFALFSFSSFAFCLSAISFFHDVRLLRLERRSGRVGLR